jgi:hypothetical protein
MAESSGVKDKASDASATPADALKDAGQQLLGLLVQRATQAATDRVADLSERLTGVAENGGTGLTKALRGDRSDDDDDRDDEDDDEGGGQSKIGSFFSGITDKVKGVFGGGGGGGSGGSSKKLKVTVISENQDIGMPLRTTYNLWTQFSDFPGFMKKVETVDQETDEKLDWKAQVWWSHRTWEATIVEQVPDSHIVWKSKGPKGHVDGGVTFTELGPNLTRVMLVLEYWPKGLFERTGNIWRAQGRRARLEFQHFRRHAMTNAILRQDEIEGWRGEIRDSEVVKTHEEALEEEQQAQEADGGRPDDETREQPSDESAEVDAADADEDEGLDDEADEADEFDEADEDTEEGADDEYEDYEDEDESADAEPDEEYDETAEADGDRDDEEPEPDESSSDGRSRRREPVGARSRRGR